MKIIIEIGDTFSERLKFTRQKAKLTQKQLAGLSDVTAATISSYESEGGTKVPSLDKVIALAKALNVSLDWLCGLSDDAPSWIINLGEWRI